MGTCGDSVGEEIIYSFLWFGGGPINLYLPLLKGGGGVPQTIPEKVHGYMYGNTTLLHHRFDDFDGISAGQILEELGPPGRNNTCPYLLIALFLMDVQRYTNSKGNQTRFWANIQSDTESNENFPESLMKYSIIMKIHEECATSVLCLSFSMSCHWGSHFC